VVLFGRRSPGATHVAEPSQLQKISNATKGLEHRRLPAPYSRRAARNN